MSAEPHRLSVHVPGMLAPRTAQLAPRSWPRRCLHPRPPGVSRFLVLMFVILAHLLVAGTLLLTSRPQRPSSGQPAMEALLLSASQAPLQLPLRPPALEQPPVEAVTPAVTITLPEAGPPAVIAPAPAGAAAVTQPAASLEPPEPAQPVIAPRFDAAYLNNPPPTYPASSLRKHEQGTTLLRVRVSAQGAPLELLIEASSGSPRLDEAAMAAVRQWRFVPAQRAGAPIEAWVLIPLEFELQHRR